ncbi:hypothetical protein [Phytoactinopolyspora mesophila]|uniref:Uncharacterized protein n=1 Tax=Phytoactinopolyspora mesophila TaxID=2650750 RepID=A0A7K3MBL1_9ACTN|nr:hypothetical protein [Phytoactinopolyspora mesophila]NDL60683.1 hypothetical protein [Phytoactinopolyspora mesophila]
MPKSKSRSRKRRAQRRSTQSRRAPDHLVEECAGGAHPMYTEQHLQLFGEAMAAEQHGDLKHALACLWGVPWLGGTEWEAQLIDMLELGEEAESWHWARFTIAAAGRWIETLPLPLVARVQREIAEAAEGVAGSIHPEYSGWVAGRSALRSAVNGCLLFDELMLEVFLVQYAPGLAKFGGGGRSWAETPGRVYQLCRVEGTELFVRDHVTGEEKSLRHLSEAVGLSPGDLVYGHLIEVAGDPGLIFAAPPIVVDEVVARKLAGSSIEDAYLLEPLEDRCARLGAAVRSGEQYCQPPVTSEHEPAPRIREFMDDGLSREEAEQLGIVEMATLSPDITESSAPVFAYHAGAALRDPRVRREAADRYTEPEHERAWQLLAAAADGRDRTQFLALAEACRDENPR